MDTQHNYSYQGDAPAEAAAGMFALDTGIFIFVLIVAIIFVPYLAFSGNDTPPAIA